MDRFLSGVAFLLGAKFLNVGIWEASGRIYYSVGVVFEAEDYTVG